MNPFFATGTLGAAAPLPIPWTGATSTAWATASNWAGPGVPSYRDLAFFPSASYTSQPNTAGASIAGIVNTGSGAVTISGTGFSIGAGGISNRASGSITIAEANTTTLTSDQTWASTGGRITALGVTGSKNLTIEGLSTIQQAAGYTGTVYVGPAGANITFQSVFSPRRRWNVVLNGTLDLAPTFTQFANINVNGQTFNWGTNQLSGSLSGTGTVNVTYQTDGSTIFSFLGNLASQTFSGTVYVANTGSYGSVANCEEMILPDADVHLGANVCIQRGILTRVKNLIFDSATSGICFIYASSTFRKVECIEGASFPTDDFELRIRNACPAGDYDLIELQSATLPTTSPTLVENTTGRTLTFNWVTSGSNKILRMTAVDPPPFTTVM